MLVELINRYKIEKGISEIERKKLYYEINKRFDMGFNFERTRIEREMEYLRIKIDLLEQFIKDLNKLKDEPNK